MYRVIVLRRAQKDTRKLPKKDRERVSEAIASLAIDPFQGKALQAEFEGTRVLRVWPYRIMYTVEKQIITVTILKIGHRQGVYK